MKIAFLLPSLANQGPIIVAKDIVNNIIKDNHKVDVFYFDNIVEVKFDCNCYKISIWKSINFDNYDIVHSHMLRPDFYIWKIKKQNQKTKFITTLHQDIWQNLRGNYNSVIATIFEKVWLYLIKSSDYIVMLSETMKEQYLHKLNQSCIRVIYNGRDLESKDRNIIEIEDYNTLNKIKSKYNIIGVLALLTKRKGVDQLIKALPFLENFALVIVGDGKEKDNLMKLAKKLDVADRCCFLGYRTDAHRYLYYFDIYSQPSISEGFGLVLLEAGLYKKPVICSDIPIFRELFSDNEVCFFQLNDTQSLVDSINKTYYEKEDFSLNIYNKVVNIYGIKEMTTKYLNLYKELIKS